MTTEWTNRADHPTPHLLPRHCDLCYEAAEYYRRVPISSLTGLHSIRALCPAHWSEQVAPLPLTPAQGSDAALIAACVPLYDAHVRAHGWALLHQMAKESSPDPFPPSPHLTHIQVLQLVNTMGELKAAVSRGKDTLLTAQPCPAATILAALVNAAETSSAALSKLLRRHSAQLKATAPASPPGAKP